MPNLRDLESLLSSLGGRIGSVATSPFHGDVRLGSLSPFGGSPLGGRSPFSGNLSAQNPFAGKVLGAPSPFAGRTLGAPSPFAGGTFGGMRNPFGSNPLSGFGNAANPYLPPDPNSPSARAAAASDNPGGTATYSGLDPNVSRWAGQMQSTFGDLGADMPDIMLAIISNESHGDPNVQNAQGYPAYGLFQLWQQPGLNVDQQFAAAHSLAQDKLRGINASYQAHGLNPDARTRARDFALAWGGHFDYNTGLPNPSSADVGSGQTAEQLANVFLGNYDKVKAGKRQAATGTGMAANNGEYYFPVEGYTGPVQLHHGSEKGATDIMAPRGSGILAMHGGTVTYVGNDSIGGWNVMIQGSDGKQYYYAHMDQQPLVQQGMVVRGGTRIGVVGDSGNAKGTGTHLHIGVGTHIINGTGPQGGAGDDFDLVGFLNGLQQQNGRR